MRTVLLAATALCSIPLFAVAAAPAAQAAQSAPAGTSGASDKDDGLSEIVVTAQRREQSVQDVPVAISAFSAEQLARQGASSALDIAQFVPNMIAQNNTGVGSANAYYIRGLGNTETIPTFDPPVGTYIDDIYLSRQNANNLSLFDVERIEVLRGPQGTLFGRNTTGGAINVIMRKPDFNEVSGYGEIGYGSYNKKLARASINIPLAPTFAVKLSAYWQNDDGYVHNVTTGERLNDDDGWGARIGVRGDLGIARWNAGYAHIVADGEALLNFDCNPAAPTSCNGRFATLGMRQGRQLAVSPFLPLQIAGRKAFFGLGNYTQTDLVTSNLEFDVAQNMTLSFITGFINQAQQYALDFADGRALPSLANPIPPVMGYTRGGFAYTNDGVSNQFSQEIKLNGKIGNGLIDYVTGFYYIKETNRTDFADVFSISPTTSLLLGDRVLSNSATAYAGYFQGDINVTNQIVITGGIRYTDETKTLSIRDSRPACNAAGPLPANCVSDPNLFAPSGVAIPRSQQAKIWTPRLAINFKPNDDLLIFASATRGFKSGGWNARGTSATTLLPFGPEKIWSYEAGIKSELFDKRVRANLTVYQADVKDLQTPSALVNPVTGAITFLTRNFADYRNRGAELELTFAPARGLNFFFNGGYQNDKYIINTAAPAVDVYGIQSVVAQQAACKAAIAAGRVPGGPNTAACAAGIVTPTGEIATPVRTPNFTVALGGSYRIELPSDLSLVPSVNGNWHSNQEVQTSNYSIFSGPITGTNGTFSANPFAGNLLTGSQSLAAWQVNATMALIGRADGWQLTAGCTNCFDKAFAQTSLANTTYISPPRMWTVKARVNF